MKGNVARINWSYDVICIVECDVIYPTTLIYTWILQPVSITSSRAQSTMETEKLIGTGQEYKEGSSATNKAGSWKGTGRRTIGQKKNQLGDGSYIEYIGLVHGLIITIFIL